MASEVLAIPEEHVQDTIRVIRAGLEAITWVDLSIDVREALEKWCDDNETPPDSEEPPDSDDAPDSDAPDSGAPVPPSPDGALKIGAHVRATLKQERHIRYSWNIRQHRQRCNGMDGVIIGGGGGTANWQVRHDDKGAAWWDPDELTPLPPVETP